MIGDGRKPSAQTHAQGGGASIESGSHPWSSFDGRRMNASSSSDRVERIRRKAESKGLGRSPVRSISPETTRHFGDVVRPPRNSCLGESPVDSSILINRNKPSWEPLVKTSNL